MEQILKVIACKALFHAKGARTMEEAEASHQAWL